MNQVQLAAENLITSLFTSRDLKRVSILLESLSANSQFKQRMFDVVTDDNLNSKQKAHELTSLISKVNLPQVRDFLSSMFESQEFWLFDSQKLDHFDEFVKAFQFAADNIEIVYISTAIALDDNELRSIGQFFATFLKKHAVLSHVTNPAILGGAQVRVGHYVFDYSLKAKLDRFQKKWVDSLITTSDLLRVD